MCTVKEHKEHHAQYVKEQKSKDDKLQKKLDHGTGNKVTIILNTNGKHKMLYDEFLLYGVKCVPINYCMVNLQSYFLCFHHG